MRDVEEQIAEWRRQMAVGGITNSIILDELESHLRDDVEEQLRSGLNVPLAFESAVRRLGHAHALELEFKKVGEAKESPERVKHAIFTLAGIPNQYLGETMNASSNIEPRWATYLKASAFLLPAVSLWLLSIVFLIPKLQQISAHAGGVPLPGLLQVMMLLTNYGWWILLGILVLLALLEWRVEKWPRYRRAAVGFGTFLLNAIVLISIFTMVVTAILVAPALMQHAK